MDRPDDLLDLAEYAGVLGGRARIGVQVMFTTDPGRLLAFRKEYSSRYDGAAPVLLARINCHGLDPDVKRLAPECLVDYGVTAENVHTFYDDAVWLAEHARAPAFGVERRSGCTGQKAVFRPVEKPVR